MEQRSTSRTSPTAAVRVGSYTLEVGSTAGTFVLFESSPEKTNARDLATALSAAPPGAEATPTTPLLHEFVEDASVVTARCEKGVRLFNDLAAGKALDPKVVSEEIDALLGLLARLDRAGRHKEALRLARDLAALLALFLRWVELVRTVRLALRTARSIGDREAEAWALHELGSLHLGAGDAAASSKHLSEALRIKEELGAGGRCASRHNLEAARRELQTLDSPPPPGKRRWLRLVGGGAVIATLAVAGLTLGLATPSADHAAPSTPAQSTQAPRTWPTHHQDTTPATRSSTDPDASPTTRAVTETGPDADAEPHTGSSTDSSTSTDTSTSTSPPITPPDSTRPQVVLDAPVDGSFVSTAVPTFRGAAGLAPGDLAAINIRLFRGVTAEGDALESLTTRRDDGGGFSVAASVALSEGTYTARVEQRDQAGNVGTTAVTFTVDLTPPVVTLTSPKARSQTTEKPTFSGFAGTLAGDLTTVTLTVSPHQAAASIPPVETLTARRDDNGSWTVDSRALPPGDWYGAIVTQADEAGHTGSAQVVFFVAKPAPNPK
jgi:hypothetical protein